MYTTSLLKKNGFYNKAEVKPIDVLVFVGESLTLTCVLKTNSRVNISKVYFKIVSNENDFEWLVPQADHIVLNQFEVSINLTIREEFRQRTTVECKIGNNLLRSGFIDVERPIRNITNLASYYLYKSHVNITWSLGQVYNSLDNIGVDVRWSTESFGNKTSKGTFNCSTISLEYCVIAEGEGRWLYTFSFIYVRVTVYSKSSTERPKPDESTNATSEHVIYIPNATKSSTPVDLSCISPNGTCVNVLWSNPDYLNFSDTSRNGKETLFHYNLTFAEMSEESRITVSQVTSGLYSVKSLPVTLCSLRPFTNYTVGVQVKLLNKQPWSDWSTVTIQTEEDRPLTGPPVSETSFFTTECSDGVRDVYVYWKKPHSTTLQGVLTGFEVDISPSVTDNQYVLPKMANYIRIASQVCEQDYKVNVYSTTKVGRSFMPSVVFIPKSSELELLNDLNFKIEDLRDTTTTSLYKNLSITWKPVIQGNATLVFYICQESVEEFSCSSDYSSTEVDAGLGNLYFEGLDIKVDLYGYAVKLDTGQTKGITWTKCVYNRNAKPGTPKKTTVNSGADAGSLDIAWFSEACGSRNTLVDYYIIYICESGNRQLEACQSHNVSSSAQMMTVRELNMDQEFDVSIRAATLHQLGELSDFVTGRTKARKEELLSLGGVLATGFIITLVVALLALVLYLICHCRKSKRKFSKLTKARQHEDLVTATVNFSHQVSDESGIVADADFPTMDTNEWPTMSEATFICNPSLPLTSRPQVSLSVTQLKEEAHGQSSTVDASHRRLSPPLDYVRVATHPSSGTASELISVESTTENLIQDTVSFPETIPYASIRPCKNEDNPGPSQFIMTDILVEKDCSGSLNGENLEHNSDFKKDYLPKMVNGNTDYVTTARLDSLENLAQTRVIVTQMGQSELTSSDNHGNVTEGTIRADLRGVSSYAHSIIAAHSDLLNSEYVRDVCTKNLSEYKQVSPDYKTSLSQQFTPKHKKSSLSECSAQEVPILTKNDYFIMFPKSTNTLLRHLFPKDEKLT
nr:leukemia inhibitory factor receptor-like isoform X2 [Biomphalaria glabrata]